MPGINNVQTARSQYEAFTAFAKAPGTGGRTAAQIGQAAGSINSIGAKEKADFICNIGRGKDSRTVNDTVRDLFKEAVVKMFGGHDKDDLACLPESVKTALKVDDYGKGKPLTARRILAVQTAVRQQELEDTLANAGVVMNDVIRARIKTAVSACGSDEDAFAVLKETWPEVIFANSDKVDDPLAGVNLVPRGTLSVRSKASAIASDVKTLREVTGDDKNLFHAAKPFLALKGRAPLSKSRLTGMVAAVKELQPGDLAAISSLDAGSKAEDVHKAVLKLSELVDFAIERSGLGKARGLLKVRRDDYREQLLASMILAKAIPDRETLQSVHDVLRQDEIRGLKKLYKQSYSMVDPNADAFSTSLASHVAYVCLHLELSLSAMKRAVDQICDGVLSREDPIEPFEGFIDPEDNSVAQDIQSDILDIAKTAQGVSLNIHRE